MIKELKLYCIVDECVYVCGESEREQERKTIYCIESDIVFNAYVIFQHILFHYKIIARLQISQSSILQMMLVVD